MATYGIIKLSGSTDGKGVKIAATATPGTTIHTAVAGTHADDLDFPEISLANEDTVTRTVTIEWGGTTAPDNTMTVQVGAKMVARAYPPAIALQNGLLIKAFCDAANVVVAYGSVRTKRQ